MRFRFFSYFAILSILQPCWAGDPRIEAKLKKGQSYKVAKGNLIKLGFKTVPTNLNLSNRVFDSKIPEIVCGHIKNDFVNHDICVAAFENKAKEFINVELVKTRSGDFVLDEQ